MDIAGLRKWVYRMTGGLLLLLGTLSVDGQLQQTERYEITRKQSDAWYNILSLKEQGLALIRDKEKYEGNKKLWEITFLDMDLAEQHKFDVEVNHRYTLLGYEISRGLMYLLFRTGETTRSNLELIELSVGEGTEVRRFEITPELDFKITHFNKVGPNIVFGGYVTNEPAILLFQTADSSMKVIPGFFQKDNELVDLRVNENETFNAVLVDRSMRSQRKLVFKTFDAYGNLLLEDVIPLDEDRSLQNSLTSTLKRNELMLLGTWGDKQGKQSLGFFSLTIDPFREQKVNYVPFGLMDNFLNYLKPKRAERIQNKTREDVEEGSKPSFSTYVMPFRVAETKGGFMMLAQVYHASSSMSPWDTHAFGRPSFGPPYYHYYNPFWPGYFPGMRMYRPYPYGYSSRHNDNVKIYSAVVAAFDGSGKMLWDQSLVLDDVRRPALEQVADFYVDGENVYFLYKKESELMAQVVSLEEGTASDYTEQVMLDASNDEIRSEKEIEDGVRHWIGKAFYTWGYHTIRNRERREDRVRDVFYINKVVLE